MADPDCRKSITVIETVSADGRVIDPVVIMKGAIFKEKHFDNSLTLLAMSKTGFTNDQLALSYIHHFDQQTLLLRQPAAKRLLLMDGHSSHLTFEWVKYCEENGIVYFLLPSHSTHLLRPLDIGFFQSYKHYHQAYLEESVRWAGLDFNKAEFFTILQDMRSRTFKARVIRSSWTKAGLIPFNPQVVLDALAVFVAPKPPVLRPRTPENQIDNFDWSTCAKPSQHLEHTGQYSEYINRQLKFSITNGEPPTEALGRAIEKRDKAISLMARAGMLTQEESASKARKEKEKAERRAENRHLQKHGILKAKDRRLRAAAGNEAEDAEVEAMNTRALERAKAKEEKEQVTLAHNRIIL